MPVSADCKNTQSKYGRNATPLAPIQAGHKVLGGIELDPASDTIINAQVDAERIYTIEQDGFSQNWEARTCWLNPPGTTVSQGRTIKASQWFRKLYHH